MVNKRSHENLAQLQTQNKHTFLALVRQNKLSYFITIFNLILVNSKMQQMKIVVMKI